MVRYISDQRLSLFLTSTDGFVPAQRPLLLVVFLTIISLGASQGTEDTSPAKRDHMHAWESQPYGHAIYNEVHGEPQLPKRHVIIEEVLSIVGDGRGENLGGSLIAFTLHGLLECVES
jgi:hypothetical protein